MYATIRKFQAGEPYRPTKPIPVSLNKAGQEWIAAVKGCSSICIQGESQAKAVRELRSRILDLFEDLSQKPATKLGPIPTRQLQVLRQYIRRK